MQANYVQRLRLTFGKDGPARYIGHLDLAKSLERAFIRGGMPIAYTQGYNPRPRMQIASALPLGFTSQCELADIWLSQLMEPSDALKRLSKVAAPGIPFLAVEEVDLREPPLQNITEEALYSAELKATIGMDRIQSRIDELLSSEQITRERRGKEYDLRPLIHDLALSDASELGLLIHMRLKHEPERVARPDEVLSALDLDPASALVCRTQLILRQTLLNDPRIPSEQ